jgi:hypothetical protein
LVTSTSTALESGTRQAQAALFPEGRLDQDL